MKYYPTHTTRLVFKGGNDDQYALLATYATLGAFASNLKDKMKQGDDTPISLTPTGRTSFIADFNMEFLSHWFSKVSDETDCEGEARAEAYLARVKDIMSGWGIECTRLDVMAGNA